MKVMESSLLFSVLLCANIILQVYGGPAINESTSGGSVIEPSLSTSFMPSASATILPQETPTQPEPTPAPYVVFSNRDTIYHVNLDETDFRPLANKSSLLNNTVAIDYDLRRNYLFWSDVSYDKIILANLDGSQPTVIVNSGLSLADGLAWDWLNEKLYWTDSTANEIEVLDMSSGYRKTLVRTGYESLPRGIVVDPNRGYMYWTDWGHPAKIERASMDGTARETLHSTSLAWPNDITIDHQTQTIYWVDASLNKIESSHVDGSNRQLLSSNFIVRHPFSISFHQGVLYWSDWETNKVLYTPVATEGSIRELVSGLPKDPMGVKVVSLDIQPISTSNPCLVGNGGCSHLCLLRAGANITHSCHCPTGMELSDDGINCITVTTQAPTSPPSHARSCKAAGYTDCSCVPSEDDLCEDLSEECSCEVGCIKYEDCCPDFHEICNLVTTTSTTGVSTSSILKSPSSGINSGVPIFPTTVAYGTASKAGQVQNSPLPVNPTERLMTYKHGINKAVTGAVVGVFSTLMLFLIVSALGIMILMKKKKPTAVVTYESFDSYPKSKKLAKKPSFTENSESTMEFTAI